jgi:hypothetical protein
MFSLCIPTIDRYDTFLSIYLPKYIENELINEIIICDENGDDVNKIKSNNSINCSKLKLYINEAKLGPFLNKQKCCQLATNEWIVLMDSDNFADYDYFKIGKSFIETHIENSNKSVILCPSFAKPNFNYTNLEGLCLKREIFELLKNKENVMILMNTGNYIINKYLIDTINLSNEDMEIIHNSSACDVILLNTILFEQFNLQMFIVPKLHYSHVVHAGSTYLTTINYTQIYCDIVYKRCYKLLGIN